MSRALLLVLPLLVGCEIQQLSQAWQIDRTRILAVKAEPAEPAPGETVVLTSLTVSPDQAPLVAWAGCILELSSDFGCDLDQAEFIGLEPLAPPTLQVPADLLDGLTEAELAEGKNYIFTLSAIDEDADLSDPESLDPNDVLEVAYKRMPVSIGGAANHNPQLSHVLFDTDSLVAPGASVVVQPGQTYDLDVVITEDSTEEYAYLNSDGELEQRVEEPYFTWYATDGTFPVSTIALPPNTEVPWVAPEIPTDPELTLWVVVRDRRGGMDWMQIEVIVDER